jgi:hypothetical protein
MNDSSMLPTLRPFSIFTSIEASATMVPIDIRCRCARRRIGDAPGSVGVTHYALIVRIGLQRLAAAGDELERPLPLGVASAR